MSEIQVGDYVVAPHPEFPNLTERLTPCRVRAIYKNGTLRARADDGSVTWRGPINEFRKVEP